MRSVLITGGSGFFGRHFAHLLLLQAAPPDRIVIFSHGEHTQANAAELLTAVDPDHRLRFFVGDVRDRKRLQRALQGVDTVVHAAALKRMEVGKYDPEEMVMTNVLGTMNVIQACRDQGVERVVFTSTDKAFRPTSSAYGLSKALAERVLLSANETSGAHGPKFAVCRYGNVAGSTGSIIPRWRKLKVQGKQCPCTDPDCTRFWMNVNEACDLVLHTVMTMEGGEVRVPNLPAFRLGDLAAAMGVIIKVTGLPKWEKMHEQMDEDHSSDLARRMSIEEIRKELGRIG